MKNIKHLEVGKEIMVEDGCNTIFSYSHINNHGEIIDTLFTIDDFIKILELSTTNEYNFKIYSIKKNLPIFSMYPLTIRYINMTGKCFLLNVPEEILDNYLKIRKRNASIGTLTSSCITSLLE